MNNTQNILAVIPHGEVLGNFTFTEGYEEGTRYVHTQCTQKITL